MPSSILANDTPSRQRPPSLDSTVPSSTSSRRSVPAPSSLFNPLKMLGDNAQQLVVEAHRSQQTRSLLPYNTAGVRTVIRESHSLSQSIVQTAAPFVGSQGVAPTPGVSAELTVAALALNRNKRALYVYHQQRIDVLRDRFWESGGVLSAAFGAETDTRKAMTTTDEEFAKGYADLCLAFKTSVYGGGGRGGASRGDDESFRFDDDERDPDDDDDDDDEGATQLMDAVDLLGGGTNLAPPKELMVDVRVARDVGEVELLSGNRINLKKGAQYHLAREDVEAMIVAGDVEVIE
ncbi:uncharacterized protein RHOBADRAFT_45119 [Rhodotorula graminis WP1]|uniref:DNA replication complex GINS protein PSF1 n=1 Tax=Rhodotorula graminis (strain WP1) TaxID=578459 RepID=A0A0P9H1I7_RHOGW|nr:uncharacterized protein RHOBADRAFT_45119 [Rhodotorula graminis WP1]KPV73827.1 hypothetical protein RHOBADRAFT_45119 [Rhodotorula graminis WP1]